MIKRDAIDYLQDLYKFSKYYAKLLDPLKENNLKIRCYLERINRLEQATVYPFLLNCYHDYEENKLSEADFISVLQILENFIICRFVYNVQTRGLNRIFSVLYSQVRTSYASCRISVNPKRAIARSRFAIAPAPATLNHLQ